MYTFSTQCLTQTLTLFFIKVTVLMLKTRRQNSSSILSVHHIHNLVIFFSALLLFLSLSPTEQYHLNNSPYRPYGQALPRPHSNHNNVGINKYTSLKAVGRSHTHTQTHTDSMTTFTFYNRKLKSSGDFDFRSTEGSIC